MGLDGAAASLVLVKLVGLGATVFFVWAVSAWWQPRGQSTWAEIWSTSSFSGFGQYLRVSLPSLAMVCASWW